MTQTLDAGGQFSRLDSTHATQASTSTARATTRFGTFAITFGIAFALLYTVLERLNWPMFTFMPVGYKVYFGVYRPPRGEGPPMYWYGWLALSFASALVVALIATRVPDRTLRRTTFFFCVLAALWPTLLTVLRSFGADWQSLDAEFMNSVWAAAVPAVIGTAAITYFVPAQFVQRVWTSLLLIVPIGGLIVLGASLQQYFVR